MCIAANHLERRPIRTNDSAMCFGIEDLERRHSDIDTIPPVSH
jgi:hypothetical protein